MDQSNVVLQCSDLQHGDEIEARKGGRILHKGPVNDRLPEMGLLWIMDRISGGRKLLALAELEITKVPKSK